MDFCSFRREAVVGIGLRIELGECVHIMQLLRLGDLNLSNSTLNINVSNFRVRFSRCLDTSWEQQLLVLSLSPNFPSQTIWPESLWYESCIPIGQGRNWREQESPL